MSSDRCTGEAERPTWLLNASKKPLWQEDDALTPDRERIGEAWERIFGMRLDLKKAITKHDDGDADYYLFRDGTIACLAFDGGAIYETNPALALAVWRALQASEGVSQ